MRNPTDGAAEGGQTEGGATRQPERAPQGDKGEVEHRWASCEPLLDLGDGERRARRREFTPRSRQCADRPSDRADGRTRRRQLGFAVAPLGGQVPECTPGRSAHFCQRLLSVLATPRSVRVGRVSLTGRTLLPLTHEPTIPVFFSVSLRSSPARRSARSRMSVAVARTPSSQMHHMPSLRNSDKVWGSQKTIGIAVGVHIESDDLAEVVDSVESCAGDPCGSSVVNLPVLLLKITPC